VKVGIVCPYDWSHPGGVRSHILGLAGALPEVSGGRWSAEIIAPATRPEPGIWAAGRTLAIPANGSVARIAFGPGVKRRLDGRLSRGDLDVLHLHEPAIPSLSLLSLMWARLPLVATFHASAERSLGYAAARPFLGRFVERIDLRVAVSAAARSLIGTYFPGDYRLIPNGVTVARFAGAAPDPEMERLKPYVLFVGRPEPRKGFDTLVEAMGLLRRRHDVRLVTTSAPAECPDWVVPLGRVGDDRLPGIYAAADVYCAPSRGGESFGIVLVEAMAAGTPVVCSDLPGYREAAGAAAAFVPPGDAAGLAAALSEVLTGSAGPLVEAGRRRAAELDWRVLAPEILALYERYCPA
jgi:phosphatidylinositol alpha-mannosyltransferase